MFGSIEIRSLVEWIHAFTSTTSDILEMTDGVELAIIMGDIYPNHVDLNALTRSVQGNWVLKANNLRLVTSCIEQFYRDYLGVVATLSEVDVSLIAKSEELDADEELVTQETAKLIELILGCAVQCEQKTKYIHPIMEMESSYQASLMHIIENIMTRFPPTSPRSPRSPQLAATPPPIDQLPSPKSSSSSQFQSLKEENEALRQENQRLSAKTQRFESEIEQARHQADASLRDNKEKQGETAKLQRRVDAELQELRAQLEEKNTELIHVKEEGNERITQLEIEMRRQADELDIVRSKNSQMSKMEATLAKYKSKLDATNEIRQQMKDLENQNNQYLEKILDLESSLKAIPSLKSTIEKYKDQVVELETSLVQANATLSVKDNKIGTLQEELESALGGKEFLGEQLESARSELDKLKQKKEDFGESSLGSSLDFGDSLATLREKVMRLERENRDLREGGSSINVEASDLENDLDDAKRVKRKLEAANFELQQQNNTLLGELDELKKLSATSSTSIEMNEMNIEKIKDLEVSNQQLTLQLSSERERNEDKISSKNTAIEELTKRLKALQSEVDEAKLNKEKMEAYTKKTLQTVQEKYLLGLDNHKTHLKEKDDKIAVLENHIRELRSSHKREEALIMSAFYEVGEEMQRRMLKEKQMQPSPLQPQSASWISRQRTEERAKRLNA